MVFGPIVLFFGVFLVLIVAFFGFIAKLIMKTKAEEWTGVVTDKKHNTKKDDETHRVEHFYYLGVKLDNGTERNLGMAAGMWEKFEIGDRLHKPKGKLFPEKI